MPGCAICTFTLPNGRLCNAVALRGHALCRHHSNARRPRPRRLWEDQLQNRLSRYRCELDAMDLPRLLDALVDKLDLIRTAIPAYPEAQLILTVANNRLLALLDSCFAEEAAGSPDPLSIFSREELERYADRQAASAVPVLAQRQANPPESSHIAMNPGNKISKINYINTTTASTLGIR
jgi:hypothetical protein